MPKQVWQADDGTQFDNEKECLLYEKFFEELKKRSIPKEFSYLPCGGTDHAIAKNFYEFLKSTRKCLDFLESVEEVVAPNEKMIRQQKEKANRDAQIKEELKEKKHELLEEQKRNLISLQIQKKRKKQLDIWNLIKDSKPKGPIAVGYWEEVYSRKIKSNDQDYAKIASLFKDFHDGKISNYAFNEQMNK